MRLISIAAVILCGGFLCAQDSVYMFMVKDAEARPGGPFSISVYADAPVSYQGFSLSVRFPQNDLEVERIGVEGTILEAIKADFIDATIFPAEGIFNIGVLVDILPPFDGELVPAIGIPLEMAHATGRVLRETSAELKFAFDRTAQRPAVPNVFSVENFPVIPELLVDGVLKVEEAPRVPAFIRGDANLDRLMDVSDAITILSWRFLGDPAPKCEDAADVNADVLLDISDGVYLLSFLYMTGQRPLPPQIPGPNPLPQKLGCREPLEWMPGGS